MNAWLFQFNAVGVRSRQRGLAFTFILDGFVLRTPGIDAAPRSVPPAND